MAYRSLTNTQICFAIFSENEDQSDDESDENLYERVFDQILEGFKKPKPISLWEHSTPNSPIPLSPVESPPVQKKNIRPKVRPRVPTPDKPVPSRIFPAIRRCDSDDYSLRSTGSTPNATIRRCDSDDYGLRKVAASPKSDLKSNVSMRYNERRFSDVESPFSPGYDSVQVKMRFNYQGKPLTPPVPAPRKTKKGDAKPLMVTNGYDKPISKEDDIFSSNPHFLKVGKSVILFLS